MKERSIKKMLLVTIVLSVMVLAGFSVLSGNAMAAEPKVAAGNEDTLIIAFQQDIPNLNIFDLGTNTVWKSDAIGWGWDTLMGYTPDLQLYLNMAESYEVNTPDGLNVTVHLRRGITFHDGVEMTADDVVFTYDVLCYNPLYQSNLLSLLWPDARWTLYDGVGTSHVGVEKIDDYTVAFHLYQPYPLFYHIILNEPIIPLHIWKDHLVSAGTGDSDDVTIDTSFGKDASEAAATIGTGPFKFVDWKQGAYVIVERYDDYWGKDQKISWQGKEWSMFPKNVKRIEFKIYNTLDTAVLALRKGEVHFIDWSIPAGYYNQMKTDPHIGTAIVDDQGFFYIAFNMRKAPMNDLAFRTAVAHCIDKDYIVTTLLQGFGTKGTVPISITSGAYINTSAIPPDFDLDAARDVLDEAGYRDINGDGWREAPDGSPIKETILTPPKDYDPVRAEAGIMIQANLHKVGLNIQSSPTDFDTIVSKAFVQVSFDMFILGWAVGSFPETYLKDFFYSKYAAPVGNNAPGYSNPKVDQLLDEMEHEMDTQKRLKIIKDIEGILVKELPYDVLYYRKNIMSYRKDIWTGWVSAYGTIYNGFSLGALQHPGAPPPPPTPKPPSGGGSEIAATYNGVVLHTYIPDVAYAGSTINVAASVTDADGVPIPEVTVYITASTGYEANATTGDSGLVNFNIPLAFQIYHEPVTVNYAMSAKIGSQFYNYTGSKEVKVYLPKNVVMVSLSMDKEVLTPGESATVTAKVTDIYGNPMAGVEVKILTQETAGTITPSAVTDSNGVATFDYTAPQTVTNMNMMDIVRATVSVNNTILGNMQTATLMVPIQSSGSSWYKVSIESVGAYGLTAGQSTDIKVKVVDNNGNPVANHDVYIEAIYSNATDPNWYGEVANIDTTNVQFDADHKATDSNGEVTFTMTAVNNINRPYIVRAYTLDTYSAFDSVEIYVGDATGSDPFIGAWTDNYGMDISVTPGFVANGGQEVTVKVKVYNTDGTPAADVSGYFGLFFTDYGLGATWPADDNEIYLWFAGDFYAFTTDENGEATVIATTNPLMADQPVYVDAWVDPGIGGDIWLGAGFEYPYLFGVKEGFVLTRAPIMAISSFSVDKPYFSDKDLNANATIKVVDINGPLANVDLAVSWSIGEYSNSTTVTTGADGTVTFPVSVTTQIADGIVTFSVLLSSADHAMSLNYEFDVAYLAGVTELSKVVILHSVSVNPNPIPNKGTGTITLRFVGGLTGGALTGMKVTLSVPAGDLDSNTKTTDSNGEVSFQYTAPDNLLPSHYEVLVSTEVGKTFAFGLQVGGQYDNAAEIVNELNKIPDLTDQLNTLQQKYDTLNSDYNKLKSDYDSLQSDYKKVKDEKSSATTMEYVFLVLFIIFLILTPVMYIVGKKQGAPKTVEEETVEEPTEEEETEEIEEETSEETSEEEKEE